MENLSTRARSEQDFTLAIGYRMTDFNGLPVVLSQWLVGGSIYSAQRNVSVAGTRGT